MNDFINQGKGSVFHIWGIRSLKLLQTIYTKCREDKMDFYNPSTEYKTKLLQELGLENDN